MTLPPLPSTPGLSGYIQLDEQGARLAVPARDFRVQALLVLILLPVLWFLIGLLLALASEGGPLLAVGGGLACALTALTTPIGLLMMALAGRSSRKTEVRLQDGVFRLANGRTLPVGEVRSLRLGQPSPMMKWLGLLARTETGEVLILGRLPPSRSDSHEALGGWLAQALGVPLQVDVRVLGMSPKGAAAFCYMPFQGIWLIFSIAALFTAREPAVRFAAKQSLLYYLLSGGLLLLCFLPLIPLVALLPQDVGPAIGGAGVLFVVVPLAMVRLFIGTVAAWKAWKGDSWVIPGLGFLVRGWLPLLLLLALPARAQEVHAQIDWQAHPAMHQAWPFFARGLTDRQPEPTWQHQFRQTVFTPYMEQSGVRLFLAAAMAAERARNPAQARRLILRQLAYVEDFVADNPERFALARSPEEARALLTTTDKMVIVHSIEGGRRILTQPEDAAFWASQGVALVTLIHLLDDELGGAALNGGLLGRLINPAGAKKLRRGQERGLTERGRQALVELGEAGILVDLTHMSQQSVGESLSLMAERGMPPVVTHGMLSTLTAGERSFSPAQVVEIYRLGGVFNLALTGLALAPDEPEAGHCSGTLHSFGLQYEAVQQVLAQSEELRGHDPTSLAVGWSSDWNGWTSHSRPVYGPGRCRPLGELPEHPLAIDTVGLAHPGLLPQHWQRLEEGGVELEPMLRSAERFLRLWEQARGS